MLRTVQPRQVQDSWSKCLFSLLLSLISKYFTFKINVLISILNTGITLNFFFLYSIHWQWVPNFLSFIYCVFQDHIHPSATSEQVVVCGNRAWQHSCSEHRVICAVRLCDQLEQGYRGVSIYFYRFNFWEADFHTWHY